MFALLIKFLSVNNINVINIKINLLTFDFFIK